MVKSPVYNRYIFLLLMLLNFTGLPAQEFPPLPDWEPVTEINIYDGQNLWEYIDGAADQFISYGFQLLRNREYSRGETRIAIDLYQMGSPLNAFGIYTAERPLHFNSLAVGGETVIIPPSQALMFKDQFYLKIYAYQGELTEVAGRELCSFIAQALPGQDGYPEIVKSLPLSGKVPASESFARESYLGLSELQNCIYARYNDGSGKEYQIFRLIPERGDREALIQKLSARQWKFTTLKGETILFRFVPYQGLVGIIITGNGSWGVTHSSDENNLLKKLQDLANL